MKKNFKTWLIFFGVLTSFVSFANEPTYGNNGGTDSIAIGQGSSTEKDNGIAIGTNANTHNKNSIAIGKDATVYAGDGSPSIAQDTEGIAIGTNARAIQAGKVYYFIPIKAPNSVAGIAIGKNTMASESSINIGMKSENKNQVKRAVTTVGAETYTNAHFTSMLGSYSRIDTADIKHKIFGDKGISAQGFASSIVGSLNKIDATSSSEYDGMGNTINGFANVLTKTNGNVIIGSANKVSNTMSEFNLDSLFNVGSLLSGGFNFDAGTVNKLLNTETSNKNKNYLGSVSIIGGQNTVDYALYSSIQGLNNNVKGSENNVVSLSSVAGYKNNLTDSSQVQVSGLVNDVDNATQSIVFGKNNKLSGTDTDKAARNIIFGFNDDGKASIKTSAKNILVLGNNVKANIDNSVYLGSDSTEAEADSTKGMEDYSTAIIDGVAYNFAGGTSAGIITFGSKDKERRLENVSAGLISEKSTDAINGSQLYALNKQLNSSISNNTSRINNNLSKINNNSYKIDNLSNVSNAGIASAMATANIPQVADYNHRHMIGAGVATYNNQYALALGYSGINKKENLILKANASINTTGNYGVGIGLGYTFGDTNKKNDVNENNLESFKKQLASLDNSVQVKELQAEITKLKTEQSSQQNNNQYIKELQDKVANLEKQIKTGKDTQIVIKDDSSREELDKLKAKLSNLEVKIENGNIERKGKKIPISCSTVGQMCTIRGFQVDSRKPSTDELDDLKQIVNILNTYYDSKVIDVIGHTDNTGNADYNLELGLERAKTIVDYLERLGLSKNITIRRVASLGENEIVSTNKTQYGRYQNRRVELFFYNK